MHYLVTYDIVDTKKRTKLFDLLGKYGRRVNYSVFECELTDRRLKHLLEEVAEQKLIDKKSDSFRFYHVCQNCIRKSFEIAKRSDPFEAEEMFV